MLLFCIPQMITCLLLNLSFFPVIQVCGFFFNLPRVVGKNMKTRHSEHNFFRAFLANEKYLDWPASHIVL